MGEPKILLIRSDHLGDVLLTLPAVAALKRSLPSAHLTYLVASGLEPVLERCPFVDEAVSLPYPTPDAAEDPTGWDVARSVAPGFRDRFDMAVLLRPRDPWSGALVQAAGIPVRLGFARDGMERFLTKTVPETPNAHAVLLALDLVTAAFRSLDGSIPPGVALPALSATERVFVPTPSDEAEAESAVDHVKHLAGTRPLIVHPGTSWELKNWPAERWGNLASRVHRRFGIRPLITGGSSERGLVAEVVEHSMGSAVAVASPLSLGGFGALLSRAALLAASDSGPLHLAAMLGTPVVGLYGPGDPTLAAPWCEPKKARIVRIDLPCSPCGTMYDPPCGAVRDPACMTGVNVGSVLEAVDRVLPGVP